MSIKRVVIYCYNYREHLSTDGICIFAGELWVGWPLNKRDDHNNKRWKKVLKIRRKNL